MFQSLVRLDSISHPPKRLVSEKFSQMLKSLPYRLVHLSQKSELRHASS